MSTFEERVQLMKDAMLKAGIAEADLGQGIDRLMEVNQYILGHEGNVPNASTAEYVVEHIMKQDPTLRLLWPETGTSGSEDIPPEPEKPAPRRLEKKPDIVVTKAQMQDNRIYEQAMREAKRDGVKVLVEEPTPEKFEPGLQKDSSGLLVYAVLKSELSPVQKYQAAAQKTAEHGAKLTILDG